MKKFLFTAFIAVAMFFGGAAGAVDLTKAPDVLVEEATNDVLNQIKQHPELRNSDIKAINQLVDAHIMPYLDFARMTRMAVGPQWRSATPEQQTEIQKLFKEMLISVYSGAVKEAADYTVTLKNNKLDLSEPVIMVRSVLTASQKDPIQLDYRLFKDKNNQWKIFDVNVSGVWLIENYRSQFASVIANGGIDGLIKQLKERSK